MMAGASQERRVQVRLGRSRLCGPGWVGAERPTSGPGTRGNAVDWQGLALPSWAGRGAPRGKGKRKQAGELGPAPTAGRQPRYQEEGGLEGTALSAKDRADSWVRNKKGPGVDVGEGGCLSWPGPPATHPAPACRRWAPVRALRGQCGQLVIRQREQTNQFSIKTLSTGCIDRKAGGFDSFLGQPSIFAVPGRRRGEGAQQPWRHINSAHNYMTFNTTRCQ